MSRILPPLMLLAWLPTLTSGLAAQAVRGTIMERESGRPLLGATIVLVDSVGGAIQSSISDERGEYRLRAPRVGEYSLLFRRVGFQAVVTTAFSLGASTTLTIDVALSATTTRLDTIIVRGKRDGVTPGQDFFSRHQALGRGVFLSRLDVLSHETTYVTEVLESVPELRLIRDSPTLPPKVRGADGGCIVWSINRMPLVQPPVTLLRKGRKDTAWRPLAIDGLVLPRDVAGIEVYPRSRDVPREWQLEAAGCGLIMVWTNGAW